ncbi:hypothetical protein MKX03_021696 [Papaver bracteatum]|nr:hypothetical protein MKX03_021696 [Papaver bracteatum]
MHSYKWLPIMLFVNDLLSKSESKNNLIKRCCHMRIILRNVNGDKRILWVFDGHGENGHKVSNLVINRLPKLLLEQERYIMCNYDESELESTYKPNEWRRDCVSAFKIMDKEIKLQKDFDSSCNGTAAITIIKRQDQDLVIANLGDSRAVIGRISDGELKVVQLTIYHKPNLPSMKSNKGKPDVDSIWSADDDYMSFSCHVRAFEDFHFKNYVAIAIPQITHIRFTIKDQFLVLAIDGVIASIVWSVENKEVAAKVFVKASSAAWRHDYPSS